VAKKNRKKIIEIQTNNYLAKIQFIKSKTWYSLTKTKISMINRSLRISEIQLNQINLKKKNLILMYFKTTKKRIPEKKSNINLQKIR